VITFLQAPTVNFVNNLDLMPFIQYAETQTVNGAQVLKPSWYLVDMEFGFEIWDGGQGLALNNFSAFATSAPVTPVPAIASLSPAIAGPGASVTLNGSNFGAAQGSSAVRFGNTPAAITSWSNTAITAIVPSISLGQTNVAVTVNSQTSTPVGFTVGSTAAAVSAAAGAVTVSQAGSATDAITVSGFTGNVTLAVSGLPSGVTGSFGANPTPGSSVLTLTASSTAALGSYKVTVTGTSGSATASTTLTLTVGAPVAPRFTLAPSSPALSIAAGLAGTETVAFTASGGFTGAVTYAVTGLPAGVTAVFGTNPVHGAIASENGVSTSNAFTGSTVLALFTKSTTAPATATVTVTGSSGTLTASTTFTLAVTAAANAPSGYWHTSGNQILDANNKPVRMASINWYGLEQQVAVPSGLLVQDYHTILQTMVDLGYNTIRIPFSNQVVETPAVPQSLWTASINQDLAGLNSMQILDRVVATAGALGLHVILDNHRSDAGNSAEENGLWYTAAYPESSWIADWKAMAARYAGSNTVIGMDLRDEPHAAETGGSCWGCGTTTNDWRLAAERAGNAIQAVNPNLLIFVEGNDCFNGDCDFWGGNLEGVASYPVVLNTANHLVYSPHDYGPNLYGQPWFNSSTTPSSLQATWNKYWGYIFQNKTAPLWIGEFGTTNASADIQSSVAGSQGQWFQSLVAYLQANPSIGWGYWAINGEDTYALLDANYDPTPVSTVKQSMLASIEPAGGAAAAPSFTLGVSAGAVSVSQAGNATDTITIAGLNGFNGAVTLGVSGLPAGVTAAFATNPATASSVLTLTASSSAAVGTATVTVTGTSGSLSATTTMALTVSGKVAPSFTLSAAAATATLVQAATTTDTIAINAQGGFSGAVTLSASGLPAGVTAGFGSNPATGTSVLTFSASSTAAAGTYTITVNGTSGAMTASTTISLVVQAAGAGFACHVVYTVPTSWAGGFTAALTLYNTGTTAISNWNLTWTYANGQTITSIWNAGVAQSGANVTLSNLAFNGTIPAGGSYANIGFNGTWNNATNAVPASFSINGVLCK
jgi:endoglucanase